MDTNLTLQTAIASLYSQAAGDRWLQVSEETTRDWSALAEHAQVQGLAPLLYDALRQTPELSVPQEIMAFLRKQYYDTAGYNLLLLRELVAILRVLAAIDVEVVVLKGAALILNVYDRVAYRPMVDLDLLISFENLSLATESLHSLGYTNKQPFPFQDDSGLIWNEVMLVKGDQPGPIIELHWHLLDNPHYATRLSTEKLLSRSRQISVADVSARVLDPEDQIIHLCCHNLYHHMGYFTRALVDIAFMLSKYGEEMNWDEIISRSIKSDTRLAVRSTLQPVAEEWYISIPATVLEEIEGWKPTFRERFYKKSQGSEFLKVFRTLFSLPGMRSKVNFIRGQLLPEKSYLEWRYNVSPDTPLPVGYARRYLSGISSLSREILGRQQPKEKRPTS